MFALVLHRNADRAYRRLPVQIQARCSRVFLLLQRDPFQVPNVHPLHGEIEGCFRARVGDWRIIYEVDTDEGVVIVHDIGLRGDVY